MKIQDFYKHLKNNLDDWEYRSVFADWLFDHNYPELEKAQRWMIENKKHPYAYKNNKNKIIAYLWGSSTFLFYKKFSICLIDNDLLEKMQSELYVPAWFKFRTLQRAETKLAKALA